MVIMGVSGSGKSTIGKLLADSLGCAFLDADDFHSAENKEKMRQGIPLTDSDRLPWLETLRDLLIDYILWGKMVILSCSALKPSYRNILRTADLEWMLEMQEQEKDQGNVVFKELSDQGLEEIRRLNMRTKSTPEMSKELSSESSKEHGQLKVNSKSLPLQHTVQFFLLNGPIELFASRLEHRFKEGTHFMPPSLLQSQMDSLNVGKDEEDIIFLDASMSPDGIVIEINKLICHKV